MLILIMIKYDNHVKFETFEVYNRNHLNSVEDKGILFEL